MIKLIKNYYWVHKSEIAIFALLFGIFSYYYSFLFPIVRSGLGASDEFITLAATNLFSGQNWGTIVEKISNYYGFGYSVWLTPIFILVKNPIIRYRILHMFNAAIIGFIGVLCYKILVRFLGVKNIKHAKLIAISIAAFSFENVEGTMIGNELMLYALMYVCIYILLVLYETKNKWKIYWLSFFLAFICVYSFTIHTRCLFMIGALVLTLLVILLYDKRCLVNIPLFAGTFIIGYLIVNKVTDYVQVQLWNGKPIVQNTVEGALRKDGVFSKFGQLLTKDGIYSFFESFFGRLFGIFTISGGLLCIAIVVTIYILIQKPVGKDKNSYQIWCNLRIISCFLLFAIMASMLLFNLHSTESMMESYKTQKITKWMVYIRYHILYFIPLLLILYSYLTMYDDIKTILKASATTYFITLLMSGVYIFPYLNKIRTYGSNINFYYFMPFTFSNILDDIGKEFFVMNAVVGVAIFSLHIFFMLRKNIYHSAFLNCLVSMYIFLYLLPTFIQSSMNIYNKTDDIYKVISSNKMMEEKEVTEIHYLGFDNAVLGVIQFNLSNMVLKEKIEIQERGENEVLISNTELDVEYYGCRLDAEEYIYSSEKDIINEIKEKYNVLEIYENSN